MEDLIELYLLDRIKGEGSKQTIEKCLYAHGKELVVTYNEKGAPTSTEGVFLSISHKNELLCLAEAAQPIGCDLEVLKPNIDYSSIAKRFFSPCERVENVEKFYRLWTVKEAVVKLTGESLIKLLATDVNAYCGKNGISTQTLLLSDGNNLLSVAIKQKEKRPIRIKVFDWRK